MSKAIAATLVPRYTDKAHKAENIAIEMIIALTKLMMIAMGTMTWCTVPGEREGEVGGRAPAPWRHVKAPLTMANDTMDNCKTGIKS